MLHTLRDNDIGFLNVKIGDRGFNPPLPYQESSIPEAFSIYFKADCSLSFLAI